MGIYRQGIVSPSSGSARTALNRLLKIAGDEGLDVDEFFREQAVDPDLLLVKGRPLDRKRYLQVASRLIETLALPDVGLRSASHFELGDLGILGHAILSSPNIADAISAYVHYRRAFGSIFELRLLNNGDKIELSTRLDHADKPVQRYLLENWLFTLPSLSALVPETDSVFEAVHVPYAEPECRDRYDEQFRCPIHYESPVTRVVINREMARVPLKYSNPVVHEFCKSECDRAIRRLSTGQAIDQLVRDILRDSGGDFPGPARIADKMNMSERNFRRKLAEAGTNYNRLPLDVRMELASEFQKSGVKPIKEIALDLGYKDVASYHRAFKSYFGVTPKQYPEKAALSKMRRAP